MGFAERILEAAAPSSDLGVKIAIARVVRSQQDSDIARQGVCSVITEDNVFYNEVLISSPSRFSRFFPDTPENDLQYGSRVLIACVDSSPNKPFIFAYLPDRNLPDPDLPMDYYEFENNSLKFKYDGNAHTELLFDSGRDEVEVILAGANSHLSVTIEGIADFDFQEINTTGIYSTIQFQELNETYEDKFETTERFDQKITEKLTQKIEELENEVKTQKTKIESLEAEVKKYKLTSDTLSVTCQNISLSSESPSDAPVLFNQLNTLLSNFLTACQNLTVICSSPGSPSSIPVNASVFASLKAQLNTLKSKYIKID